MTQSNTAIARHNMVSQQIRTWNVLDHKILKLIAGSPREDYVPEAFKNCAYSDSAIPMGNGEYVLTPQMEGKMLQALGIQPTDTILEIGTGSGHLTSLLAQLGKQVYSVELDADMATAAQARLKAHDISNVTIEQGDGARGWDSHQPYDVIVLTGSLPVLPESFKETLTKGGRLFAVVGDAPVMEARLVTRIDDEHWGSRALFETSLPPLKNAIPARQFQF